MTSSPHAHPSFVVPLRDLEDGPKLLSGEITLEWLRSALEGSEASAEAGGELRLELSKNGRDVLVRGRLRVPVIVPCARTLAPIALELTPEMLLLLRRTTTPSLGKAEHEGRPAASERRRSGKTRRTRAEEAAGSPRDRAQGRGASRGGGWSEDPELAPMDAAQDTFEGDKIVLDSFIREFILLELPMFPVRQDLPSLPVDARASAPDSPAESSGPKAAEAESPIDPRLAPLAELKDRLRQKKKE